MQHISRIKILERVKVKGKFSTIRRAYEKNKKFRICATAGKFNSM